MFNRHQGCSSLVEGDDVLLKTLTVLTTILTAVSACPTDAIAQSRHKVIYFKPATVVRTQYSPDAAPVQNDATSAPDSPATSSAGTPRTDSATAQNEPTGSDAAFNGMPAANTKPSLQQIQNPSGGYQMTFSNMSQGQSTAPNTYMGTQFNSWNNIQPQANGLSQFESFNRTQPPNSGWYVSPNTYVGQGFSQWSNLSSGFVTPNYLGSWNYQN